jgi:hypothetical protein
LPEFSKEYLKLSFSQRGAICLANLIIFLLELIKNILEFCMNNFCDQKKGLILTFCLGNVTNLIFAEWCS